MAVVVPMSKFAKSSGRNESFGVTFGSPVTSSDSRSPLAPSFEASDAEVAKMVAALQRVGCSGDPNFRSHGSVLKKQDVTVDFAPPNVGTPTRDIELLGECRDVTTNKGDSQIEAITFG
jgi:hypothetical protein